MKTDYRNWMPKGMVMGSGCSAAILLILTVIFASVPIAYPVKKVLVPILAVITAVCLFAAIWMFLMYRAFSYTGNRQMSNR